MVIYDIKDEKYDRSITYLDEEGEEEQIQVKISDDFRLAAFSKGRENYLLYEDESGTGYSQRTIVWLKGKRIWEILSVGKDFLFVCSREFD